MNKALIKKILLVLLLGMLVMQFFTVERNNKPIDPSQDLIALTTPEVEIRQILENACYDCHSNQTDFPWYTNVAPLSWWIGDHIEEGRRSVNFSEWDGYTDRRKKFKLREVIEMVEEKEMPLESYTWMHSDARLDEQQRQRLIEWASDLKEQY